MSALPPKADIRPRDQESALGHFRTKCVAQNCVLLDHLVGAKDKRLRKRDTERFCGLEI
jgi:hypothetical protein